MNKNRRAELDRLAVAIADLKEQVEQVLSEEQEYYDNLPENLTGGEKAARAEEAISNIEGAISSLDDVYENLLAAQA